MPTCKNGALNHGRIGSIRLLLALCVLAASIVSAMAQDGPQGITAPTVFPAFDPNAPACSKPSGLKKVLAFARDNQREFMQGVDRGLAMAAKDRELDYRMVTADNDAAKQVEQLRLFLTAKIGGMVAAPVDAPSLGRSLQELRSAKRRAAQCGCIIAAKNLGVGGMDDAPSR